MKLTISRLHHSLAVASKMKDFVSRHPDVLSSSEEDMFYLGILHDIAYEFSSLQIDHEHIGGLILKKNGYRFWKEVYYHGSSNDEYSSYELDLLNYCDMTTGPNGEDFTIQQRLDDIEARYGNQSIQYSNAKKLIEKLKVSDLDFGI